MFGKCMLLIIALLTSLGIVQGRLGPLRALGVEVECCEELCEECPRPNCETTCVACLNEDQTNYRECLCPLFNNVIAGVDYETTAGCFANVPPLTLADVFDQLAVDDPCLACNLYDRRAECTQAGTFPESPGLEAYCAALPSSSSSSSSSDD